MAFLPSELIGGDLEWLLDFTMKDQDLHFSRIPLTATISGSAVDYFGGMGFSEQFTDGIDPFGASPEQHSVEVSIDADLLLPIATEISRGFDLAAARGKLWLYERNSATAVLFLDGVVRDVEWGEPEEPVTFTIEEVQADDTGLFPPPFARVDVNTWPNHSPDAQNERYPWVIGQPGYHYDTSTGNAVGGYCVPAPLVISGSPTANQRVLVAGHHVETAWVWLICDETGLFNRVAVTNTEDGLGNPVALAAIGATGSGTAGVADDEDKFFAKFHTDGGGLVDASGNLMVGAGSILRWMLGYSRMRIDHGRLAASLPMLDQYRIDAVISCKPEKRFSPWDWVEDHLSEILPISWRVSPGEQGGWYPVPWRFDAVTHDAVAQITASKERGHSGLTFEGQTTAGRAFRQGRVSFSDRSSVANEITIEYQKDTRAGKHWKRRTLTGDPDTLARDPEASSNLYCHTSRTRYRGADNLPQTVATQIATDIVWDDATANAILSWNSRKMALQALLVSYVVDAEIAGHLEPGDVVTVTDEGLGWMGYLFIVEQITWRADRFLALDLRSLVDAARDLAGYEGEEEEGGH